MEHRMASGLSADPAAIPQQTVIDAEPVEDSRLREIFAILATVVLADLTIYRGHGYMGLAIFLPAAAVLLVCGKPRLSVGGSFWVVGGMLLLLVLRLAWYGSPLQVVAGFVLLIALATALAGRSPYVPVVLSMASKAMVSGCRALWQHVSATRQIAPRLNRRGSLNIALPILALVVFSTLFVLANPDAVTFVGRQIEYTLEAVSDWFVRAALRPSESTISIV